MAEWYCHAYYPCPDLEILDQDDEAHRLEEDVVSIIVSLDNETVLDYSVLVDTWPTEYRKKVLSTSLAHEAPTLIPSLVEISIEPSIASIIQAETPHQCRLSWHSLINAQLSGPNSRSFPLSPTRQCPYYSTFSN